MPRIMTVDRIELKLRQQSLLHQQHSGHDATSDIFARIGNDISLRVAGFVRQKEYGRTNPAAATADDRERR